MEIEKFVEKAIEGGWKGEVLNRNKIYFAPIRRFGVATAIKMYHSHILLDPKAWEAVGKTEKWGVCGDLTSCTNSWGHEDNEQPYWKQVMARMVQALINGKSLEEYIETL